MSPALLDRAPSPRFDPSSAAPAARAAATTRAAARGATTLAAAVSGAWEGLAAHRAVGCLVCGGQLVPRYGAAGSAPVGGRCTDCGSVLG